MLLKILKSEVTNNQTIVISGSKSESNRLLILKALFNNLGIDNLSSSDDTVVLKQALQSNSGIIDIHHAGTAMRFLTAYMSCLPNREVVLTGSDRMQQRPIGVLVEALRTLGADISYLKNEGFPPLKINGKNITRSTVHLNAGISSQFISALMLVAPSLDNGLKIVLEGEITSRPYLEMTLSLLNKVGVSTSFQDHIINIQPKKALETPVNLIVESDWSSASYYYSMIALSPLQSSIHLKYYQINSLQGDSTLAEIYQDFGVETVFQDNGIRITKTAQANTVINFNLNNCPDIAQTITVTAFGLGLPCDLYGLHTLKIKETDRIFALKTEVEKLGGEVEITDNSLHLKASNKISSAVTIETYNDHRMAMAFAPLALKVPIYINDAMVVTKSYTTFWNDLKSIGFQIIEE
ncbi:3-phosphoshikimate 1-carboxyvinyltransferase [Paucihalobacter ruber]|uniref:3-phosphoshikimate 1-carboxyvinyltransferase n=1 Tax=Paucihalobacter ruber TaxID=2567861 RepID=A0A506PDN3_9FLAO|nr:3-phosphoshikimate 1-carboxyvinyltransferase [Paucihalobacter ruber]TPV31973.1 3-phosphoshikimate 1-carboxyvinyltransferase [Paucihalobacter ruber]